MAKVATEKRKPIKAYFAITRILSGEENGTPFRVPEGYAYVNAWVGDGIDLTRSSMVGASDDYMRWGNVREMHQPSAVGTAVGSVEIDGESLSLGVSWDENGAFLRSKIVDPTAILKLDEGVYKGYSVGVRPKVMRGNSVIECDWYETSLVDRPADPDASIALVRALEIPEEVEVLRYWDINDNWVDGVYTFAQRIPDLQKADVLSDISSAYYALCDSLRTILGAGGDAATMNQSVDEFAAYLKGEIIGEGADTERVARLQAGVNGAIERLKKQPTDLPTQAALLTRAEQAETALTIARSERDAQAAEVTRLTAILSTVQDPKQPKPVRSVEREFSINQWSPGNQTSEATAALRAEFASLVEANSAEPSEDKRLQNVTRMLWIKNEIARTTGEGV